MEISRLQGLEPLPGMTGTPNWENPQIAVRFATCPAGVLFSTADLFWFTTPRLKSTAGICSSIGPYKIACPPRITVLWSLKGSHANDTRGAKSFLYVVKGPY